MTTKTLENTSPEATENKRKTLTLNIAPAGEDVPETVTSAGREDEIMPSPLLMGGSISAIIAAAAADEKTPQEKTAELMAAALKRAPKEPKAKLPKLEKALNEMLKPAKPAKAPKAAKPAAEPKAPRETKTSQLIAMLASKTGATGKELQEMFGWLPHTTRGAIATLHKKPGFPAGHKVVREKDEARGSFYRIVKSEDQG